MDRLQVAVCDDDQMYLEQIGEEIKTYTPQMEKQDAVLKNRAVIHYSCREEHREARMTGPLFPGVCLLSPGVCLLFVRPVKTAGEGASSVCIPFPPHFRLK